MSGENKPNNNNKSPSNVNEEALAQLNKTAFPNDPDNFRERNQYNLNLLSNKSKLPLLLYKHEKKESYWPRFMNAFSKTRNIRKAQELIQPNLEEQWLAYILQHKTNNAVKGFQSLKNYKKRTLNQKGGKESWRDLEYYDEHGEKIKHLITERKEQILAEKYIKPEDVVLELGARYGTVSCVINKKLKNKHNQVVVEPDSRVWQPLEDNMKRNDCDFHIIKGFISNKKMKLTDKEDWRGYGTKSEEDPSSKIPSYTLDEIQKKYKLKFNVLVADCEGFLCQFLEENPGFLDQLRLIIFEKDNPKMCNYNAIKRQLKEKKFKQLCPLFREAWRRPPSFVRKTRKVKKNT